MLRLALLGSPEISLHGQSLTEQITGRGFALLAYLAVTGESHTRESLAELLWTQIPAEEARSRLRDTLPRIRPWLGDHLQITRQRVAFIQNSPPWLDVTLLRRYMADSTVDPQTLSQILTLYRNDFLGDFYIRDAPVFEEWVMYQREELHQVALQGFQRLADYYQRQGDYDTGLTITKRLLALEPWCEEGHRQQMRLLALSGKRSNALAQYESCQRILAAEFKLAPDQETAQLYEQIRTGQFPVHDLHAPATAVMPLQVQTDTAVLALAAAFIRARQPAERVAPSSNWDEMPPALPCYGRQHEAASFTKWLTVDNCRLLGVFGMAGQGKSLFVRHLLPIVAPPGKAEERPKRTYPGQPQNGFDCVLWRSFTDAPTIPQLLQDLLPKLLGQPVHHLPERWEEGVGLLIAQLRRHRCLLIFDQLETIMQSGGAAEGDDRQPLTDLPTGVAGRFRKGYELYAEFLQRLGGGDHQSSLVIISRERPLLFSRWEEQTAAIRCLDLGGLNVEGGRELLQSYGLTPGQEGTPNLIQHYSGHPLALTIAAETIHEFFSGNIVRFLATTPALFDELHGLLSQQLARLTALEWVILHKVATEPTPMTMSQLCTGLTLPNQKRATIEACRSLSRRALLEQDGELLRLPALVLAYLGEAWPAGEGASNSIASKSAAFRNPWHDPQSKVLPRSRITALSGALPPYPLVDRSNVVVTPA